MKTLIRKELRENLKVTVLGLVVLLLIILLKYRDYAWSLEHQDPFRDAHPLLNDGFVDLIHFFCAVFGGLLGWLQVWNERHRDLWAFLIHRPLTRTQIFLGKSAAGLLLYLLMPGLPLLGCVIWVAVPGHVPAPFEWPMVLPLMATFLTGIVYYFAGMLTGLRQARWYGSRCLGLVLAMLVSGGTSCAYQFWQALFYIVSSIAILSVAVWGAFHSEGHYEGQPVAGKAALATALAAGLAILVPMGALLSSEFVFRFRNVGAWSDYFMTSDGVIYKEYEETTRGAGEGKVVEPVQNAKSEHPLSLPEVWRKRSNTVRIELPWPYGWRRWQEGFRSSYRFFTLRRVGSGTVWYYWQRYGCLVGYELATRRLVGSLGPNGFSAVLPGAEKERFHPAAGGSSGSGRVVITTNAVYEVDLERRATKQIFTGGDERIWGGTAVTVNGVDWLYTVVITDHSVLLLKPEGKVAWQQPFEPVRPPRQVKLSYLEPAGQFALWVPDNTRTNLPPGGRPPTVVTWFGREQGVLKSLELAPLAPIQWKPHARDRILSASLSPVALLAAPLVIEQVWPWKITRELKEMLRISLVVALVCLPVAWWLGRRYHFSFGAKVSWSGFILLTGIPGLLAFLSAQEWPAREPCPKCGKLRVVEREQCEHCGVEFAPPEKTGIEVFEPVG